MESDASFDGAEDGTFPAPSFGSTEKLLVGDEATNESQSEHPPPSHVLCLWQVFLDRVNPVTKLVHVPSVQPYLAQATAPWPWLPGNIEALLFAIYAVAVVALDDNECICMLGSPKNTLFQRYTSALRGALHRARFLKTTDIVILQALTLHLLSLQGRHDTHATWVLSGVCIRIAQKMGLHKDGQALGLPPFDTEMRRRVWWNIVLLDFRSAIASGFTPSSLPPACDCKMPTNMNDGDFYPNATEKFQDRDGPTEMIVFLLLCGMMQYLLTQPGLEDIITSMEENAVSSGTESQSRSAKLDKLAAGVEDHLDRLMQQYSDPTAGPLHQDAWQIKSAMTSKIRKMCQQSRKQLETGSQPTMGKDHLFHLSVDAIEHTTGLYQAMATKDLLWFVSTLFESELFTYLVGELHDRTSGVLVERAWELIPVIYHYHQDLFDLSIESNVILASFVLKAWSRRKETLKAKFGHGLETPAYVQSLEKSMPLDSVGTGPLSGTLFPPSAMAPGFSGPQDMPWDPRFMGFMKDSNFGDSRWMDLESDMRRHVLSSGEETGNTLPGDCSANPQAPW
ncbi:unnamed protein product [Clonostachys solani]|uniref:Xylanolytic transcriptional activator regulatory domain-containing protein n=1 Tax=Clonostachys solani TaxID=160281 RepID=A0A9P0EEM8_9HYPO|nr:unnamed protein product [Clonostachys solani]